jgi:hypothetical protein
MGWQDSGPSGLITSARVDIVVSTDTTWEDAFQFDPTGPTGSSWFQFNPTGPAWTLVGQNFRFNIKGNWGQTGPLLIVDSGVTGQQVIVIDDVNARIIHTSVPDTVVSGGVTGYTGVTGSGLIPGKYEYDCVMYDQSVPPIKIQLMHGIFKVQVGVGNS